MQKTLYRECFVKAKSIVQPAFIRLRRADFAYCVLVIVYPNFTKFTSGVSQTKLWRSLEPTIGFEPITCSLPWSCSTK